MIERKDIGFRLGAQKAQMADEFLTRSQLVRGNNITFEYMDNWDIKIHASQSSVGSDGVRSMYCVISLTRLPKQSGGQFHNDIQTAGGPSIDSRYMGTQVFGEVFHNWNLSSPNMFTYSIVDFRKNVAPSPTELDSLPTVVGVTPNSIRIIATDPKADTRFNPMLWVDTEVVNSVTQMKNTRFINFSSSVYDDAVRERSTVPLTPIYLLRLIETVEISPAVNGSNPVKI